jgi:hypothetical protein
VEDVGPWEELGERAPLRELSPPEAATAFERPVGLRMEAVTVEDHQLGVDAAPPERLDVRPRHTRRVDRAVDDAHV